MQGSLICLLPTWSCLPMWSVVPISFNIKMISYTQCTLEGSYIHQNMLWLVLNNEFFISFQKSNKYISICKANKQTDFPGGFLYIKALTN